MNKKNKEIIKYQNLSKEIRKMILEVAFRTKTHHLGSSLSIVDLSTL